MKIPIISPLIHYSKVFYGYAGGKLVGLCGIILLGSISEGFGIMMILPVLNHTANKTESDTLSRAVYDALEMIGIDVTLPSLLTVLFLAFLIKGILTFMRSWVAFYITTNLIKKTKLGLYRKYAAMKYEYYTKTNIGFLNNVITTEAEKAIGSLSSYIDIVANICLMVVYIASAFIVNAGMTILVLVVCMLLFAGLRVLSKISREMSVLIVKTNAQIQSILIQTIYYFKYLKATNSFSHLKRQINNKIGENQKYQFKSGVINTVPASIVEPLAVLLLAGLTIYNMNYLGRNVGELIVPLVFFYKAFTRVFSFQTFWQKFNAKIGGIEVVEKTKKDLERNMEIAGAREGFYLKKEIRLEDVSFRYGEKQVLCDINMVIPKNRTVGIVGESGAGKTTLFDILTGLIVPDRGTVSIDGKSYQAIGLLSLRRNIGYVTQEPVVFNDTIANNISFWECIYKDGNCKKRIEKASALANCDNFIRDCDNRYETVIGDKGIKLSGGQRQRIAIARELFKEPEIMIFDEATSSLDSESERLIQESINSMVGERTIVIIAHRLSTIKVCDYIYVLDEGRVIEEGAYGELYRDKNSNFGRMCATQNM